MDGVRAPAPTPSRSAGFTLIELMVVVAVLAVLSVTVSLPVGRSEGASGADAGRFLALHARLRDAAILSRSRRGLGLSDEGWQALTPDAAAKSGWRISGEGAFRGTARFTVAGARIVAPVPGSDPAPDLLFLPDGRTAAFEASFIAAGTVVRCTSDGWEAPGCGAR